MGWEPYLWCRPHPFLVLAVDADGEQAVDADGELATE